MMTENALAIIVAVVLVVAMLALAAVVTWRWRRRLASIRGWSHVGTAPDGVNQALEVLRSAAHRSA